MDKDPKIFDPIWENKYAAGNFQMYPWDMVVSFVFGNAPIDRPRHEIRILEVGCGSAPNLWFAAREGFKVTGIDCSYSALKFAQKRFRQDGLEGDLRIADFTDLPFDDASFDLVIDRCSLVCVGIETQKKAIAEIRRCLRRGGRFLHNIYGDSHSSMRAGRPDKDGLTANITGGTLVDVGKISFISLNEIQERFADGWQLLKVERREFVSMLEPESSIHAEWVVIAEKP